MWNNLAPVLAMVAVGMAGSATAQDDSDGSSAAGRVKRQVRFLAVGEAPPYEQVIRNGIAIELPPPPGSVPPGSVSVGAREPDGDKLRALGQARLRLGLVSRPLEVAEGPGSLVLMREEDGESEPWLRLERPEQGDLLVILWRDRDEGSWEKARAMVLGVGSAPGILRVVNVSPWPVPVVLGGERAALRSGGTLRRRLEPGKVAEFQAGLADRSGEISWLYQLGLEQQQGESSLVVLYRADRDEPRRPLKIFTHRENVAGGRPSE